VSNIASYRVVRVMCGGPLLAFTASTRYPLSGSGFSSGLGGFSFSYFINFFHQVVDNLEIDVGIMFADVVLV
jgi:hypothetical protein